jgi:hypothetical protein
MSAANRVSLVPSKSAESASTSQKKNETPELIATTFGLLTRAEIREWEKMLGRRLLRVPDHSPNH